MRIGTGTAFALALLFHAVLIAALAVNVSLDKPERPRGDNLMLMHATMISLADTEQGAPEAQAPRAAPPREETGIPENSAREEKVRELEERVAAQQAQEKKHQEAVALKKKQEAEKREAERRQAEEQKRERELALKKAEEQKKLAEEKRLAEEKARAEAKAKAEAEAKAKAEAEAKAKAEAEAEAKAKAEAKARALEESILKAGGGARTDGAAAYGARVQSLIENNWHIDLSMEGKTVRVMLNVSADGLISGETCQGDEHVCKSALDALKNVYMLPSPPANCPECRNIVISMTPKL